MRAWLGVDSGGTKCEAVLVAEDGSRLGFARAGQDGTPAERHAGGRGRDARTIERAVRGALDSAEGVTHIDLVGPAPAGLLDGLGFEIDQHHVPEHDAPMAAVAERYGILVLAGTGSFVYGRKPDGSEAILDGLGPLFGDHGSAFQIGLEGLRSVGRSGWSPARATSLAQALAEACEAFCPEGERSLVRYLMGSPDRSEIASLAVVVEQEARAGDRIARQVLEWAADDIVETLADLVAALRPDGPLPLIGAGGVARGSEIYWSRVVAGARRHMDVSRAVVCRVPHAYGLVLAAAGRWEPDDEFRTRLLGGI
jgi:N-acetylglucosamine kinase-like BadF-type ATPase